MIQYICACNNKKKLKSALLKSKAITKQNLSVVYNKTNIPNALNSVKVTSDCVCYIHQDVQLLDDWNDEIQEAFNLLTFIEPKWAVVGVIGKTFDNKMGGYTFDTRMGKIGAPFKYPYKVQTLDEMVIIINRKNFKNKFDEQFDLGLYGADICMQAHERKQGVYVIPSHCVHHCTRSVESLPLSFCISAKKLKEKWSKNLPIYTTCMEL